MVLLQTENIMIPKGFFSCNPVRTAYVDMNLCVLQEQEAPILQSSAYIVSVRPQTCTIKIEKKNTLKHICNHKKYRIISNRVENYLLILSQTTIFRHFRTERVYRGQF